MPFKINFLFFSSKAKISSDRNSQKGIPIFFLLKFVAMIIAQNGGSRTPGTLPWLRPYQQTEQQTRQPLLTPNGNA